MPFWKSMRFWTGLGTIIVSLVVHFLPDTTPEQLEAINNLVMVVAAWIVGDSLRKIGVNKDNQPKKKVLE